MGSPLWIPWPPILKTTRKSPNHLRPDWARADKRPINRHRLLATMTVMPDKQVAAKRIKMTQRVRQAFEVLEQGFLRIPEAKHLITAIPWQESADEWMCQRLGQTRNAGRGMAQIPAYKGRTKPRPRRRCILREIRAIKLT